MHRMVEEYHEILSSYRNSVKQFIQKKQKEGSIKEQHYKKVMSIGNYKQMPNKYEKVQYGLNVADKQLQCKIKFRYVTPMIVDYLKQKFPHRITIQFKQYYPHRNIQLQAHLEGNLTPEQTLNNIINRYPFQLYTKEQIHPEHVFQLWHSPPHATTDKVLNYYQEHQLQLDVCCGVSGLVFGSGKLDLQQFLFYREDGSEERWIEKVPIYQPSLRSHHVVCYLHLQMWNRIREKAPTAHIHKVSKPLVVGRVSINDKQSRLLQRISSYKESKNSIIPQMKEEGEKTLVEHQKKLQLEQVAQYKEKHRDEYLKKVMDEAMEELRTVDVEMGSCHYLLFEYRNPTHQVQRVSIHQAFSSLQHPQGELHNVLVEVVDPYHAGKLFDQGLVHHANSYATANYSYDNEWVMVVPDETILVVVKVLVSRGKIHDTYSLVVSFSDDRGEVLQRESTIVKMMEPIPDHCFYVFAEKGVEEKISVETKPLNHQMGGKKCVHVQVVGNSTTIPVEKEVQFVWENNILHLQLNMESLMLGAPVLFGQPHQQHLQCYVHVYDASYTLRVGMYILRILPCMKVQHVKPVHLGVVGQYQIVFALLSKEKESRLVGIGCSDVVGEKCVMRCMGKHQLLIQSNKNYAIHLRYLTFRHLPNPEQVVIQCLDTTTKEVLGRWMLRVPKQTPPPYKSIFRVKCEVDKEKVFPLEVINSSTEQRKYLVQSSNGSVIAGPTQPISLFSTQSTRVDLRIHCWAGYVQCMEETGEDMNVMVSVDDGSSQLLYLFQLTL